LKDVSHQLAWIGSLSARDAGAREQVAEIKQPGRALLVLVERDQFPQFDSQRDHEIRFRRRLKPLDLKLEASPTVEEVVSRHLLAEKTRAPLEVASAAEKPDRIRFEKVIVAYFASLRAGSPQSKFSYWAQVAYQRSFSRFSGRILRISCAPAMIESSASLRSKKRRAQGVG
jgi:hypothetical protein